MVIGVLLLTTTVTNTKPNYFYDPKVQTLPFFEWFYQIYQPQQLAFAQDDDEEDEDKDKEDNDSKDEEEESTKDEDEEETKDEEESTNETTTVVAEPLEQLSDEWLDLTQTKQELEQQTEQILTEEQVIKEQLNSILIEGNWTNPNKEQEQEPEVLDPSCNCTNPPIEPPNQNVMPPNTTAPPTGLQQIIINPASIKNIESWGTIKDHAYTNFYNVKNTIDNKVDEYSFWSQYDKSGFNIELHPQALKDFEVCSAEIVVHNPKSVQSTLTIDGLYNYTGILDNTTEKVDFDSCHKNVKQLTMSFDGADKKYTSIAELKLFGKLLNPPTIPPIVDPQNPKQKIEIKNSNAEISIINSTVTFKFDPESGQATNYNVITIPVPQTGGQQ